MKKVVKKLTVWCLVMLMTFGCFLMNVNAASVVPTTTNENNPEIAGYTLLYKDIKTSGTYTGGAAAVTVTFDTDGKFVDWSSDKPISYVYVKGGDSAYLYHYDPAVKGDTQLRAPGNNGGQQPTISHVNFYYKPGPELVTLTIKKVLQPSDGTTDVSLDPQGFMIKIKSGDQIVHYGSHSNGSSAGYQILPGEYTIEEDFTGVDQTIYSLKKITVDGVEIQGNTITIGSQGATVIVYNEKKIEQPDPTGQITIKKIVQKQVGQEWVAVNDDPTQFKVTVVTEDRIEEIAGSPFTVSAMNPYTITGLPYGTYRLAEKPENMPAGYEQYMGPNYNNVVTIDANNPAAEYTFFNRIKTVTPPVEKGTVTIQKNLLDENNRPIVPTGLSFSIKLTDFNGRAMIYTVPVGVQYQTALLPIGAYTVEEVDIPNGYELVGIDHSTFNLTTASFTVTVTNKVKPTQPPVENGSVRVVKTIGSAKVPQKGVEFKLHVNAEDIRSKLTDENGIAIFEGVPVGTYTLEEVKPTGFNTQMTIEAPQAALTAVEIPADSIQVAVKAGETSIVNVVNTPIVNQGVTYEAGYKITGHKFNDLDKDGERDENEPGLAGWTIELWPDNRPRIMSLALENGENGPIATTVTDENGYYEFTGLSSGYYLVKEVQKSGWECSTGLQQYVYLNNPYVYDGIRNLIDDLSFKNAMPDADKVFEAEGRIGRVGDYELAIKTMNPTVVQQKADKDGWLNYAEPQPFTLSCYHSRINDVYSATITFSAMGETIQYSMPAGYPSDIMIRTRSAKAGSGILVTNLKLNDIPVKGTSVAVNGVRDTDILWLEKPNLPITKNFTLTGETMMFWDTNNVPKNSELAFQIAVGRTEGTETETVDFGNYQTGGQQEAEQPTLTKTDNLTSARPGDTLTYKIAVDPNEYSLRGAYLLESPDPNTEYIGGDEWQLVETKADGSKIYRYNLYAYQPTLSRLDAPYAPQIPDFKVRVKSSIPRSVGSVTNIIKLYFDEEKDPITASDMTAIIHPTIDDPREPDTPVINPGKPDLVITKTDNGSVVSPGGLVEYVITVENKGNAHAQGVKIYESQPEGATFVTDRNLGWTLVDGKYVYDLGTLNVGEKKQAKFMLKVNDPFPAGLEKILNNVEVKDNGIETATTDNKASDDTPILIAKPVVVEPPVTPPTPPTPPIPGGTGEVPDLPFTGGVAEVELLFAGLGALLMGAGIVLKKRK